MRSNRWRVLAALLVFFTTVAAEGAALAQGASSARVLQKARQRQSGGDPAGAVPLFQKAVALEPDNGQIRCELGWAALHSGNSTVAERQLDEGLRLLSFGARARRPSKLRGMCLYNRGRLAEEKGQLHTAMKLYARSLKARPGNRIVRERLDDLRKAAAAPRPPIVPVPAAVAPVAAPVRPSPSSHSPRRWVTLPAGTFEMGTPAAFPDRHPDETLHSVRITRAFELSTTEVTQSEFAALMGYNPARYQACGLNCPVEQVSWHEAAAYCNALSARSGLPACYVCDNPATGEYECEPAPGDIVACRGYRLPTEAEWEYAARGATSGPVYRAGPPDDFSWYAGNSQVTYSNAWLFRGQPHGPHPVATTPQPGPRGLYDMLGNVWEWCHDWRGDYPRSAVDPSGPEEGISRVLRGGSWASPAWWLRPSMRDFGNPSFRFGLMGFRVARTL